MLKYDKPFLFTRRRKRLCLISTFLVSLLFIFYQFLIYYLLSSHKPKYSPKVLPTGTRGIQVQERMFYTPVMGKFICITSREVIDFIKVNDDYCDCEDSSDEPGTNACPDGFFYCSSVSTNAKYPKMVHSSRVNDGICDCCDGSEEYDVDHLLGQQRHQTNSAGCPNNC